MQLSELSTNTRHLVERQLALWPEHRAFLTRSFAERTPETLALTERTASQVVSLVGDEPDAYCEGYRWMCEAVLEEELFFRRHGRYQATSFADVARAIYDDPRTMKLYMDGLLLSQVFWRNHVDVAHFYEQYLRGFERPFAHLEIGPGHGLLLAQAAQHANCAGAAGWDISDASLVETARSLRRLDVGVPVVLEKRNIYALGERITQYDSIVVSEVLEHLEDPEGALRGIRKLLTPGGRAFINIPCNSPAPDHLYLFSSPDDFFSMLERTGFAIVDRLISPSTGWTLERALRNKLAISSAAVVKCAVS